MNNPCIYIMYWPEFPGMVKIGYATDVEERLKELNSSTSLPFPMHIYATYEVETPLSDKSVHRIIDTLNPELRVSEQDRVREFYYISAEKAYELLESIALINGRQGKLTKYIESGTNSYKQRSFSNLGLEAGTILTFHLDGNPYDGETCFIIDNHHVDWNDESWTLSSLAREFLGTSGNINGQKYFYIDWQKLSDKKII